MCLSAWTSLNLTACTPPPSAANGGERFIDHEGIAREAAKKAAEAAAVEAGRAEEAAQKAAENAELAAVADQIRAEQERGDWTHPLLGAITREEIEALPLPPPAVPQKSATESEPIAEVFDLYLAECIYARQWQVRRAGLARALMKIPQVVKTLEPGQVCPTSMCA